MKNIVPILFPGVKGQNRADRNQDLRLNNRLTASAALYPPPPGEGKKRAAGPPKIFSEFQKNLLTPAAISDYTYSVPPEEGCFANVTNAGWDAVDADGALTRVLIADGEVV
jgi:hypothetical protein